MARLAITLLVLGCMVGCREGAIGASGVPVTQALAIELRAASETEAEGMEPMQRPGSQEMVYVASKPLLTNEHIAAVWNARDSNGQPSLEMEFTDEGSQRMSRYTREHHDSMIALLVDGKLMQALHVLSVISERAAITGKFSPKEVEMLYMLLTAGEMASDLATNKENELQ